MQNVAGKNNIIREIRAINNQQSIINNQQQKIMMLCQGLHKTH